MIVDLQIPFDRNSYSNSNDLHDSLGNIKQKSSDTRSESKKSIKDQINNSLVFDFIPKLDPEPKQEQHTSSGNSWAEKEILGNEIKQVGSIDNEKLSNNEDYFEIDNSIESPILVDLQVKIKEALNDKSLSNLLETSKGDGEVAEFDINNN